MFKWSEAEEAGTCSLGIILVGGYVDWAASDQLKSGIPARRWYFGKDSVHAMAYFETDEQHIVLGDTWLPSTDHARRWVERKVEAFLSQKDAA